MPRITQVNDLAQLNRQFQRLDLLISEHAELKSRVEHVVTQVSQAALTHAQTTLNTVAFHWDGPTLTLSWADGSIKNKSGSNVPVVAGSLIGLVANKTYWLAWNSVHKKMAAQLGVDGLLQNPNNFVLCQVFTGTAGQTGSAGGGGANSASDLSGGRYKLF